MESGEQHPEQFEIGREKFIEFAKKLAEILGDSKTIKRTGIVGSVSRGKEFPSDLDYVIFIDQNEYSLYLLSKFFVSEVSRRRYAFDMQLIDVMKKIAGQSDEKNFLFEQVLGLDREASERLATFMITEYPRSFEEMGLPLPHIVVLPDKMKGAEGLVRLQIMTQRDPTFLTNISSDYAQFNPEVRDFIKQPIYSEEEMAEIQSEEFRELKEIISNPEHPMYEIWEKEAREKEEKKYKGFVLSLN